MEVGVDPHHRAGVFAVDDKELPSSRASKHCLKFSCLQSKIVISWQPSFKQATTNLPLQSETNQLYRRIPSSTPQVRRLTVPFLQASWRVLLFCRRGHQTTTRTIERFLRKFERFERKTIIFFLSYENFFSIFTVIFDQSMVDILMLTHTKTLF